MAMSVYFEKCAQKTNHVKIQHSKRRQYNHILCENEQKTIKKTASAAAAPCAHTGHLNAAHKCIVVAAVVVVAFNHLIILLPCTVHLLFSIQFSISFLSLTFLFAQFFVLFDSFCPCTTVKSKPFVLARISWIALQTKIKQKDDGNFLSHCDVKLFSQTFYHLGKCMRATCRCWLFLFLNANENRKSTLIFTFFFVFRFLFSRTVVECEWMTMMRKVASASVCIYNLVWGFLFGF